MIFMQPKKGDGLRVDNLRLETTPRFPGEPSRCDRITQDTQSRHLQNRWNDRQHRDQRATSSFLTEEQRHRLMDYNRDWLLTAPIETDEGQPRNENLPVAESQIGTAQPEQLTNGKRD